MLRPLGEVRAVKRFAVMDAEGEDWSRLSFFGFYDGKAYRRYDDLDKFVTFLVSRKHRHVPVYAHNLSYDGMFILDHIIKRRRELEAKPLLSGTRMIEIIIKKKKGKGKWILRDSYSILPSSLARLTHDFDVKHKKLKESLKGMITNPEYNKYDCMGLYEVLEKFFLILNNQAGQTISQTALMNFRKYYLEFNINSVRRFDKRIRQAYYGGRSEIFKYNLDMDKDFYYWDINSLYPSCMKDHEYPIGRFKSVPPDLDLFGFTLAKVKEEGYHFPFLPERIDKKMLFLNGSKYGWYSNQELRTAEKLGYEIELLRTVGCHEGRRIFKDFVTDWYKKRLEARSKDNKVLDYVCKLMLNSLYGKFGQRPDKMTTVINPKYVKEGMRLVKIGDFSIFQKEIYQYSRHIIPSISALVCANARLVMLKNYQKCRPDEIYYTDTDSAVTSSRTFCSSKDLGDMKLEGKIHGFVPILPKVYYYKTDDGIENLRAKGLPFTDSRDDNKRLFLDYISCREVTSARGLESFKRAMIRARVQKIDSLLMVKSMKRSLKSYYDKRKINAKEGYICDPFDKTDDRSQNMPVFKEILGSAVNCIKSIQ